MTRMRKTSGRSLYVLTAAALLLAVPAHAQFKPHPMSDPATGETYHIEASAGFWNTSSQMSIASEGLGILGSTIDFKNDLGLESGSLKELRVVARPGKKHKLRFELIPVDMTQQGHTLTRSIVFNGQRYQLGLPVASEFKWTTYRFGYEYDFLSRDRWFAGVTFDIKQTDVRAELDSPILQEYAHARGPVPALGGIGRYYPLPNVSVTGEYSRIPYRETFTEDYKAKYADFNLFGTVNFNNYVGAQFGYRSFDVGYKFEDDTGSFVVKGPYFGIVARY
jgi:hypothetical protein